MSDEWWSDWRHATAASKWGGESETDVEAMYQAFKRRLMAELVKEGIVIDDYKFRIIVERVA
jgi:hypothetical protein